MDTPLWQLDAKLGRQGVICETIKSRGLKIRKIHKLVICGKECNGGRKPEMIIALALIVTCRLNDVCIPLLPPSFASQTISVPQR